MIFSVQTLLASPQILGLVYFLCNHANRNTRKVKLLAKTRTRAATAWRVRNLSAIELVALISRSAPFQSTISVVKLLHRVRYVCA
jgi:hypothetical protein